MELPRVKAPHAERSRLSYALSRLVCDLNKATGENAARPVGGIAHVPVADDAGSHGFPLPTNEPAAPPEKRVQIQIAWESRRRAFR